MTRRKVRENFGNGKKRREPSRSLRLALEPLESRRLLAGLNVNVYLDQNNSRDYDNGDAVAPGRLVYLDLNRNDIQDVSDPFAITNDDGIAEFFDLPAGDYSIGLGAGNVNDKQTTPTRAEVDGLYIAGPSSTLVATTDLNHVWSFDDQGRGERVVGDGGPISYVDFGSKVVSSLQVSANEFWVITGNQASSKLTHFDAVSGQFISQSISGLNARSITKLVKAGSQVVAQMDGASSIQIASLSLVNGVPTIGPATQVPGLTAIAGSMESAELAIVSASSPSAWSLSTFSVAGLGTTTGLLSLRSLPSSISEVSFSRDGSYVFAAQSGGGVLVYSNTQGMPQVATLAEAAAPILTMSHDGRFVSGSTLSTGELILWQQSNWMPRGRTNLQSTATDFVVSEDGDTLLSATSVGVIRNNLSRSASVQVTVQDGVTAAATIGVREIGINTPPPQSPLAFILQEDAMATGELRSEVIDVDGDEIWFTTLNSPAHGRLDLSADGQWVYQPDADFFGIDRAVVKAYDGQTSSDFSVEFNVLPIDDPPTGILIELSPIPENARAGTDVGSIAVIDHDSATDYQFAISDSRFEVIAGRLTVASGARFDYESEPTVYLHIVASENSPGGYQIDSIASVNILDVLEPPTEIYIIGEPVAENQPGSVVGIISLPDSSSVNDFTYALSDERFEVVNGELRLKPNVSLDYEAGNVILISVSISASSGETTSSTVTVDVANRNDAPTAIDINLNKVTENTAGQVIGSVSVIDQDQELYSYTVSDPRFEVVSGQLKLKEGQTLDKLTDGSLELIVNASGAAGVTVSQTVVVEVQSKPPAFQNPSDARDVNSDGEITPLDALLVLNTLNRRGPRIFLPDAVPGAGGESPYMVDVNGDGRITPIDVLLIINYLNRRAKNGNPAGTGIPAPSTGTVTPTVKEVNDPPQTTVTSTLTGQNDPPTIKPEGEAPSSSFGMACPAFESPGTDSRSTDSELETLLEQISRERLRTLGYA